MEYTDPGIGPTATIFIAASVLLGLVFVAAVIALIVMGKKKVDSPVVLVPEVTLVIALIGVIATSVFGMAFAGQYQNSAVVAQTQTYLNTKYDVQLSEDTVVKLMEWTRDNYGVPSPGYDSLAKEDFVPGITSEELYGSRTTLSNGEEVTFTLGRTGNDLILFEKVNGEPVEAPLRK